MTFGGAASFRLVLRPRCVDLGGRVTTARPRLNCSDSGQSCVGLPEPGTLPSMGLIKIIHDCLLSPTTSSAFVTVRTGGPVICPPSLAQCDTPSSPKLICTSRFCKESRGADTDTELASVISGEPVQRSRSLGRSKLVIRTAPNAVPCAPLAPAESTSARPGFHRRRR